jgi:hypothetical protein
MEPALPKGHDLPRDGRYALHCALSDSSGVNGEFLVSGRAQLVHNAELRALAVQLASYTPAERSILFECSVESAASTTYVDGQTVRARWTRET